MPSSSSFAVERQSFTLEWTYTLDGTLFLTQFFNVTVSGSDFIGRATIPGNIIVQPKYQARFRGQVLNTQAVLTILSVQRSDQGTNRINVAPTGSGSLSQDVKVEVLCKD